MSCIPRMTGCTCLVLWMKLHDELQQMQCSMGSDYVSWQRIKDFTSTHVIFKCLKLKGGSWVAEYLYQDIQYCIYMNILISRMYLILVRILAGPRAFLCGWFASQHWFHLQFVKRFNVQWKKNTNVCDNDRDFSLLIVFIVPESNYTGYLTSKSTRPSPSVNVTNKEEKTNKKRISLR